MGTTIPEDLLARRRALGQDRYDEVWEGEYRMNPGPAVAHARVDSELVGVLRPRARKAGLTAVTTFNVGDPKNYRVPDQGYVRDPSDRLYVSTADVIVEVLSPGDDTYAKFGFYADHGIAEIIVADPATSTVEIYALGTDADTDTGTGTDRRYRRTDRCDLLDVTAAELQAEIDWPHPPA